MKTFPALAVNNQESKATAIVLTWGILVYLAGYLDLFSQIPLPFFGLSVLAVQLTLILLYFFHTGFRQFSDSIPLSGIALFHAWRIFAGWVFLLWSGKLPETFIENAAYGDIIAGFLGLGVWVAGKTKWSYWLFNLFGAADFVLAVGTGLTLTLLGDTAMRHITILPLILIPLFGVPLSGYTHFVSLYRLVKSKPTSLTDTIS
jgi:hypothetical protein